MKKTKVVEYRCCDFCVNQKEDCYYKCLGCDKDVCYNCLEIAGIKYNHGVYVSGYGDGFYCHECDSRVIDRKHDLYAQIAILSKQREIYNKNFQLRANKLEKELRELHENEQRI